MKNLYKKYNTEDSLIVISGYPKKGETYSQGVCAVSSFTKNTLTALKTENPQRKIVVLTLVTDKNEVYEENEMLIVRCFKRNSPLSYFNLLQQIRTFGNIKNVLIEFEFASFGNTLMTGLLSPVVWMLFLMKKNITIVCHQVILDIRELSGHIGLSQKNPLTAVLNQCLKLFYILIMLPAKKVIVLEEEFKDRLEKLINPSKITVIPHGIDTNIKIVNKDMKKIWKLKKNDFVVLYFGYLTWYKGVDFLINALKNVEPIKGKNIKLVIAGGASFTQKEKIHYQKFLKKVKTGLKGANNIISTGFVKEEDISPVFKTADLAVLPYRVFMSSSGPLSLAISHNTPFILSEELGALTNSVDIAKALKNAGLNRKDIIFKLNKGSLVKAIGKSMDPKMHTKMVKLSKNLNNTRAYSNLVKKYEEIIYSTVLEQRKLLSFPYGLIRE